MKLVVVGCGQGGGNIADEFAALGKWVWENRRIRIFTGGTKDPIHKGVFAINMGAGDLYGLKNIPQTDDHTILIGTTDEFRGRGAGKNNRDGAEQARKNARKILGTIEDYGDVYSADAIMVIGTTAGGTGSGSVGVVVDLMKEAFKKPVYAMLVLPFENQYTEPDSIINTGTCIKKVLTDCEANAVFLIDNQKFVRKSESMTINYAQINRRIVDSFMDILCVGEETDSRYIGEVLDANDVIRILHGPTAIGVANTLVPPPQKRGWTLKKTKEPRHFSKSKEQIERAQGVVHDALNELSIDCEIRENGKILYHARAALGLFSGPSHEATEEIVEMMDNCLAEKVPGADRRKGTYPGRSSDTIQVTTILTGIGHGAFMNKVQWLYKEAAVQITAKQDRREEIRGEWDDVSKLADDLPSL